MLTLQKSVIDLPTGYIVQPTRRKLASSAKSLKSATRYLNTLISAPFPPLLVLAACHNLLCNDSQSISRAINFNHNSMEDEDRLGIFNDRIQTSMYSAHADWQRFPRVLACRPWIPTATRYTTLPPTLFLMGRETSLTPRSAI